METILVVLEIIGTVTFAVTGAVTGIKKKLDVFGVSFLSITTAVGGGIIRDVCLGRVPPTIFTNYVYVTVALCVSFLTFCCVFIARKRSIKKHITVDALINIFDALGLGVFTINGMNIVLFANKESSPFLVIFVGLCSGIGGGVIRDLLVRDVPYVLHKQVYAVAALAGGIVYYLLYTHTTIHYSVLMTICVSLIFILRLFSAKHDWHLPKINL